MGIQRLKHSFIIVFFLLAIAATLATLSPNWKSSLEKRFWGENRDVLGLIQGQIRPGGSQLTFLKVREGRTLFLEVHHTPSTEGPQGLITRAPLPDRLDARVQIAGRYTNLAIVHLSRSLEPEILAPTLDANMVPRFNLFKFDEKQNSLIKVTQDF